MEKYLTGTFERQYKKINKVKLQDAEFLQKLSKCKVRLIKGDLLNVFSGGYVFRNEALNDYSKLTFNEDKYYKVWEYTVEDNSWYGNGDKHQLLYIEPYNGKVFGSDFMLFSEQEREIKLIEKDRENEVNTILTKYNAKIRILRKNFETPKQL